MKKIKETKKKEEKMEGSVERKGIYFKKDKKNEKKIQEKKGGGNIKIYNILLTYRASL